MAVELSKAVSTESDRIASRTKMKRETAISAGRPPRALVDLSVRRRALTLQTTYKPKTIEWGGRQFTETLLGVERKPAPNDAVLLQEVQAIPTIARLASEGKLQLCIYNETEYERWAGKDGEWVSGDLLKRIDFHRIEPAVNRHVLPMSDVWSEYDDTEKHHRFLKFLRDTPLEIVQSLAEHPAVSRRLRDLDRLSLRHLQRFRDICKRVGENKLVDAFHIWTCEVNQIDYLLLIDFKLERVLAHPKPMVLNSCLVSPSALLARLGISEWDPMPYQDHVPTILEGD